jgi:hypothetical protein
MLGPDRRSLVSGFAIASAVLSIGLLALAPTTVDVTAGLTAAILWCRWLDANPGH